MCFMKDALFKVRQNEYVLLIFLWFVLTSINMGKAFTIDDTFHLETAKYIMSHPLRPMSGIINWGDDPVKMSVGNQPPLFFYIIGAVGSVFGYSKIPMHLLLSVFTFLSLFLFLKILRLLNLKKRKILLSFFAFCPALIINQNIMIDVPLLTIVLSVAYFLFKYHRDEKLSQLAWASLLLGAGMMIKYTILPLFLVIIILAVSKRNLKHLAALGIPLLLLVLWSVWNYWEFHGIHILNKAPRDVRFRHQCGLIISFLMCLGSMTTFSIALIYGAKPSQRLKRFLFVFLILSVLSVISYATGIISKLDLTQILEVVFTLNGIAVAFVLLRELYYEYADQLNYFLSTDQFILVLILGAFSGFLMLFAPFMGTRHILLIIPFIILLGSPLFQRAGRSFTLFALAINVFFGLALGISDLKYANYYENMASKVQISNKDQVVWTAGHWGWQWYALKRGWLEYSTHHSDLHKGDFMVFPADIHRQKFNKGLKLKIVQKLWQNADALTFISGKDYGSLYNSYPNRPPWNFSKDPIDTIYVCKVVNPGTPETAVSKNHLIYN